MASLTQFAYLSHMLNCFANVKVDIAPEFTYSAYVLKYVLYVVACVCISLGHCDYFSLYYW